MKTVIILEFTHDKPLHPDFAQMAAGRCYTLNNVQNVSVIDVVDDLALEALWGKIETLSRAVV